MQKIIYSSFKGLGRSDKNLPEGYYYSGQDLDILRDPDYIRPGFIKTDITITGQQSIIDIVYDPVNSRTYLFGNNARIYEINTSTDSIISSFGGANNYVTVTGMTESKGIIAYSATDGANVIYFPYNGSIVGDIAKGALSDDWTGADLDPDWGSTVPTNHTTLNLGRKDIIDSSGHLWITNGRYVARVDNLLDPAVLYPTAFDLGSTWTADRLFPTDNGIGIIASKISSLSDPTADRAANESKVVFWDRTSSGATKEIPLKGVNQVHAVINFNGNVLLFYDNRTAAHCLGQLTDYGVEKIQDLRHDISGTLNTFLSPRSNSDVMVYRNSVLFGTGGLGTNTGRACIFGYGRNDIRDNYSLYLPFSCSLNTASSVYALSQISSDKFYASYWDGTNNKFCVFYQNYSTNAKLKEGYTDFGQKVIINYIKVYFKPLVSGDALTVSLDTNYGTSNTIQPNNGVISYALDGAITSKKFDLGGLECHAVRPVISWTTGGTAISKIIIDYDYIQD
jgi:hypothetical protein